MSKPSKRDVNYRLPEQCCARCVNSSFNTYDDAICKQLIYSDIVIDFGGTCDLFQPEEVCNGVGTVQNVQ